MFLQLLQEYTGLSTNADVSCSLMYFTEDCQICTLMGDLMRTKSQKSLVVPLSNPI